MSNHRTLKYRFVQVIGRDLADLTLSPQVPIGSRRSELGCCRRGMVGWYCRSHAVRVLGVIINQKGN